MGEEMGSSEFFKILFPGDCKRKLILPDRFAREIGELRHAKLRLAGGGERLWDVNVVDNDDKYLGRGWTEFAAANDLRDGHLLVFRYDGAAVLTVTVFDETTCRKRYPQADAGACVQPGFRAPSPAGGSTGNGINGAGASEENSSDGGDGARAGGGITNDGGGGSGGSDGAGGGGIFDISSGDSADAGGGSSADAAQSQFAVTLRQCNLKAKQNQYLNVPVEFQDAHGYARRRAVELRLGGRSWTVHLKHAKRALGDRTAFKYGWHQFCVDNGLHAGDICLFKVLHDGDDEDDGGHVLKVEVRRKDGTLLA
ncbi:hypothetical protein ACP70R_040143 [Stipagrostis hirtigluma subsp. patula]